jgi:hypothetical protein
LSEDLRHLRIGAETVDWYGKEVESYHDALRQVGGLKPPDESGEVATDPEVELEKRWSVFGTAFLETGSTTRPLEEASR